MLYPVERDGISMNYIIYENGTEINRIVASEAFAKSYCEENGYTFEQEERIAGPGPGPQPPSAEDITLDMLAEHEERLCMLEITTNAV